VYDRVLSGDILVEQNIHVIDICNWGLKRTLGKLGSGGRQGVPKRGTSTGNYNVLLHYPEGVTVPAVTQIAKAGAK